MFKKLSPVLSSSSSQQKIKDLIQAIAQLKEQWNTYLYPFLSSLSRGLADDRFSLDASINALFNTFDGTQFFVDNLASPTRDGGMFWSVPNGRPITVEEAFTNLSTTGSVIASYSLFEIEEFSEPLGSVHTVDFTRGVRVRTSSLLTRADLQLNLKGEQGLLSVVSAVNTIILGNYVTGSVSAGVLTIDVESPEGGGGGAGDCICSDDVLIEGPGEQGSPVGINVNGGFDPLFLPFPQDCSPNSVPTLNVNGVYDVCNLDASNTSAPDSFVLVHDTGYIDPSWFPEQEETAYDCGSAGTSSDVTSAAQTLAMEAIGMRGRRITLPAGGDDGAFLTYDESTCTWGWDTHESALPVATADTVGLWLFQGNLNDSSGNAHHASDTGGYTYPSALFKDSISSWFETCASSEGIRTFAGDEDLHITGDLTIECWVKMFSNSTGTGDFNLVDLALESDYTSSTANSQSLYSLHCEMLNTFSRGTYTLTGVNQTRYITHDGTDFWISCVSSGSVVQVDPTDGSILATVTGFSSPAELVYQSGYVYVCDSGNNRIRRIDITDASVTNLTVGTSPENICSDGTSIWVSNRSSNDVSRVSIASYTVTATVAGITGPRGIVSAASYIWVAEAGNNRIAKINPATDTVVTTIGVGTTPDGIASDGTSLYVVNTGSNNHSKITMSTDTLVFTSAANTFVNAPFFGVSVIKPLWDGTNLWLLDSASSKSALIEISTTDPPSFYSAGVQTVANSIYAYDAVVVDGSIWVPNGLSNKLWRFDLDTRYWHETMTSIRGRPYVYHRTGDGTVETTYADFVVPLDDWVHVALTRDVVGTLTTMASDASTVGLWNFQETSGTVLTDSVGTHNGVITSATSSARGVFSGDRSRSFTGTGTYVSSFDNTADFRLLGAMSVELWVYLNSLPGGGSFYHLISCSNTSWAAEADNWPWGIILTSGPAWQFYQFSGGVPTKNSVSSSAAGVLTKCWTHLAVTRTAGGLVTIYCDGVSVGSGTITMPTGGSSTSLRIGAGPRHTDYTVVPFEGYISDVRISNTDRSGAEVLANYNAAKGTLTDRIYVNGVEVAVDPGKARPNGGGLSKLGFGASAGFSAGGIAYQSVHISSVTKTASQIFSSYKSGIGY